MKRLPHRFQLDVGGYRLLRDARPVRLERQPMELLILLASRAGALVTREEIAARFWGDGVFVDVDRSINRIVAKLRVALHDAADRPRYIETVVGKGYRLVASLDAPIRSIAVLPIENRRDSHDQDLADGITTELITELARVSPVRVIAPTSVDRLNSTTRPLCEIARELDVDGIVRGVVTGDVSHVRVTAKLIQSTFERQLCAAAYDGQRGDTVTVQRQAAEAIAEQLLAALAPEDQSVPNRRHLTGKPLASINPRDRRRRLLQASRGSPNSVLRCHWRSPASRQSPFCRSSS